MASHVECGGLEVAVRSSRVDELSVVVFSCHGYLSSEDISRLLVGIKNRLADNPFIIIKGLFVNKKCFLIWHQGYVYDVQRKV